MSARDRIIGTLRCAPRALTIHEVADGVGISNYRGVSSVLSKLAAYGAIQSEVRRSDGQSGIPHRWNVYSLKREEAN